MFKLVLVGAGGIGSRYLQGLIKVKNKIEILVIEPNFSSQSNSKKLWEESGGNNSPHKIEYINNLYNQTLSVDVIIVATSSKNRDLIIHELSLKIKTKFWIIEKVLCQSVKQFDLIESCTKMSIGSWVNTPKRLMKLHKKLKKQFFNNGSLRVTQNGGLWGLACNSIHFIDLVCWWTGEQLLKISTEKLSTEWFESKRKGYYEITGELSAHFSGGSQLVLNSSKKNIDHLLTIETKNNKKWIVNESLGLIEDPNGVCSNNLIEYQSDLTAPVLNEIFTNGTCGLPTLSISISQHKIFLDEMLKHWNFSNNSNYKEVPIT